MTSRDEKVHALDQLLHQVAETPAVQAIRERAQDSGHLDDDWILALTTGTASEEDMRKARRHVVFCDQCADLLLNRGGEVEAGQAVLDTEPAAKTVAPVRPVTRKRELGRREALLISLGLALVVVFIFAMTKIVPAFLDTSPEDVSGGNATNKPVTVAARGAGSAEEGRLSLSRLAYLKLLPQEGRGEEFIYVLLMDAQGNIHRLEPRNGPADSWNLGATVELPDEFGGYDLGSLGTLGAGQRVGFLVFSHTERISVLEGEIYERITKKRLTDEAHSDSGALDEAGFRALAARIRALELPGRLQIESIRLIP